MYLSKRTVKLVFQSDTHGACTESWYSKRKTELPALKRNRPDHSRIKELGLFVTGAIPVLCTL
jgi:hypothetical protein